MSSPEYTGLRRLFVFASGARPDILRSCPTEETAYTTLGGTVLTTAGLAGVSMTFALSIALRLPFLLCIPLGLVWGLAILNLDRWLITSTRRTASKIGQIVNALPRLALAVLLGFVISEPLVLAIFQPEITDEIELDRQAQLRDERQRQADGPDATRIAANKLEIENLRAEERSLAASSAEGGVASSVETEIIALRSDISDLQAEIRDADQAWLDAVADANEELQVGGVSGRGAGAGANYDLKLEKANSLEVVAQELREQNEATVAANQARITALQSDLDADREATAAEDAARNAQTRERQTALAADIERLTVENTDLQAGLDGAIADLEEETENPGMIAQIEALEQLGERSPSIRTAHYLLAALFIFIDVLPVLGKLLQLLVKPRPYELTVEAVDRKAKMNTEVFMATAERERDEHLRKIANEGELRARIEEENRRRFFEHAGEVQQRIGQARLQEWELANGGPGNGATAVAGPPDARPAHANERASDHLPAAAAVAGAAAGAAASGATVADGVAADGSAARSPESAHDVADQDEVGDRTGAGGPSVLSGGGPVSPQLADFSNGYHAEQPTLFDDSIEYAHSYGYEDPADVPGGRVRVVVDDDRLETDETDEVDEIDETTAAPAKNGSSGKNGSSKKKADGDRSRHSSPRTSDRPRGDRSPVA